VLQAPSSSIPTDLERIIVQKFAPRRLLLLGVRRADISLAKLYCQEPALRAADAGEAEAVVMRERWPAWLERDPYYNPNLSPARADFSLGK